MKMKNKIENTFSRRLASADDNGINFYPQNTTSSNKEFEFINGNLFYNPKTINLAELSQSINLPFQLRQPLKKGVSFFLYLEKYALTYRLLFTETSNSNNSVEINLFKDFYKKVYHQHSAFMKQY